MKMCITIIIAIAVSTASQCFSQTLRLQDNKTGKIYGPVDYEHGQQIKIADRIFTVLIRESPRQSLRAVLKATVIPEVSFRSANAVDVIEFMRMASKDYGPAGAKKPSGVNFILKLTPEQRKAMPLITFEAKQLSMLELLNTVTELAGLSYKIEPSWVMIEKSAPKKTK